MYSKAAVGMYMNYFLLGMVNVILISNMGSLTEQWATDSAGISYIIAAIGIGKLLTDFPNGKAHAGHSPSLDVGW